MPGSPAVDWVSATFALAVGLGVGAVFIWRVLAGSQGGPPPAAAPLERRDLLGKRDVLFRQLRELEDLAATRNAEQLARERYALELQAARVLQELDGLGGAPPAPAGETPARAAGVMAEKPALRGFLWGTGSMVAVAVLVYMVVSVAKPREEGGAVTGAPASAAPADPQEAAIRAALARKPDDLEARLALARLLLARQDMMGVWNETQYVLERSPGDPRALSYQALVRLAMGQADLALDMLKKAIAVAPDQVDAYVHLALVYTQMGRPKDAQKTMAEAKRRFPQQSRVLARLETEMSQAEPGAVPAGPAENPHASVPPPPPPARPGAAPATSGKSVAGIIDIDPLLGAEVSPGAIVFITVREAGFGAGPPAAVKRLVATSFPLRFEISQADSMTGEPLPDQVLLEARVDSDGDPMTRSPQDPKARQDDVKAGTTDVRMVLKRAGAAP